ncbi:MAG: hypothetical protein FDX18_01495 [Chlorobium sp.]|nr:MAG: hypothetical protein FDX18_01495 [Chlorobium sp.]
MKAIYTSSLSSTPILSDQPHAAFFSSGHTKIARSASSINEMSYSWSPTSSSGKPLASKSDRTIGR